jgi:TRAP-type C4-dicarboxylate transport system permease small subunit
MSMHEFIGVFGFGMMVGSVSMAVFIRYVIDRK